jgi:hypothetical protein
MLTGAISRRYFQVHGAERCSQLHSRTPAKVIRLEGSRSKATSLEADSRRRVRSCVRNTQSDHHYWRIEIGAEIGASERTENGGFGIDEFGETWTSRPEGVLRRDLRVPPLQPRIPCRVLPYRSVKLHRFFEFRFSCREEARLHFRKVFLKSARTSYTIHESLSARHPPVLWNHSSRVCVRPLCSSLQSCGTESL